ncbi:MAG: ABC transporter ATP-binding protein [Clostridia bacterium]|nr:ABC transporter ATP-binding protein [Clostridia bacterium]
MGANIELIGVSKKYQDKEVLRSVYLDVQDGEFLTILGPSGAGKTTVLKLVAGFENSSEGIIRINGEDITRKPTYRRNIGMLFQNYALFPHLTVEENIAFPLKIRKISKKEIQKLTKQVLEKVKLTGYEKRYPRQLSGGQQQRVALARALVFNPPILLLDEPMAALDKQLRKHMQMEIKQIQRELGITTISVTHDQEEALTMATKVCVMKDGSVAQVAKPEEIYEKPNSNFVAKFIGEANLIKAKVVNAEKESVTVRILGDRTMVIPYKDKFLCKGEDITVLVRPEKIHVVGDNYDGSIFEAMVEQAVYIGEAVKLKVKLKTGEIAKVKMFSQNASAIETGSMIKIGAKPEDMVIIKN